MREITLYHRASAGGIKVWSCRQDADTIIQKWGLEGCKMQENRAPQKTKGKVGTKAFKSATQVAAEEFDRRVKAKKDEGYVEDRNAVLVTVQAHSVDEMETEHGKNMARFTSCQRVGFDFDDPPKSFAPAKPLQQIEIQHAVRLENAGKLIKQRKRDGMRHFIFFGHERVQIYSRRMENASGQFASVVEDLKTFIPALSGTVLDAEFIVDKNGSDDFQAVASICRSADKKAQERLRYISGWQFMVFDILYLRGEPVFNKPYRERHGLAKIISQTIDHPFGPFKIVENLELPLGEAIQMVKDNKWEGLVAWEADKGTAVQLNGKPKRTNCYKLKPLLEDDFVATGYELGQGSNANVVGALFIGQYNSGKVTPVGKVGTGLSQAQRSQALNWQYPLVVQCEFSERTPDGSLRFPVFVRVRTDKHPHECVWPELATTQKEDE